MAFDWNRSRATALALTLFLHGVAAVWLWSVRMNRAPQEPAQSAMIWLPAPERMPPEAPPSPQSLPPAPAAPPPIPAVAPLPEAEPESHAITLPDWESAARAVAREFGRGHERRRFGPEPAAEPPSLKSARPPHSVFERPLPRVGTTVRTPEGEQILWVSDNCYISLGSQSLTMGDFHAARRGIRTCQIGVGRRKARGDLFDPIKRPPKAPAGKQQEPGCGAGTRQPSCPP